MRVYELLREVTEESLIKKCETEDHIYNFINNDAFVFNLSALKNVKAYIDNMDDLSALTSDDGVGFDKEKVHSVSIVRVDAEDDDDELMSYLSVHGISSEDAASCHYSMLFIKWEDWLSLEVNQGSLDVYGKEMCAMGIIDEMSFFGDSEEDCSETMEIEHLELLSRVEEAKLFPNNLVSLEECIESNDDLKALRDEMHSRTDYDKLYSDSKKRGLAYQLSLLAIGDPSFAKELFNGEFSDREKMAITSLVKCGSVGLPLYRNIKNLFPNKIID